MSFLQINSTDPSVKRPFRLSDIQDIWDGIKSLFKAISGQSFRIISGFDLVSGTYSSGTVWYNGELYEYDSSQYPITPSTTRVAFTRIAQDNRTLEGGTIQPFSYKYICGGDTLNGVTTFTYFVANIEKYKSFLGAGSVTADKLATSSVTVDKIASNSVNATKIANNAVTTTKIANNAVTTSKIADNNVTTAKIADEAVTVDKLSLAQAILPVGYTESVWLNPEIENSLANTIFDSENRLWKRCILDNNLPSAVTIDCTGTAALPNIAFVLCYNRDPDSPATVNFKIHDNINLAYQVSRGTIKGFVLIKVGANSHVPL